MPIPDYMISHVVLYDADGNLVPVLATEPGSEARGLVVRMAGRVQTHDAARGHAVFGAVDLVTPLSTATVVTLTAPNGYRLHGFQATGDGDGYFLLDVDGVSLMSGRIHATDRDVERRSHVGLAVAPGALVRVTVRNDALGATRYEATLLGETL